MKILFAIKNPFPIAHLSCLVLLSLLLVSSIGCGDGRPGRVPVSGKITIDGKPVPFGAVQFKPVGGGRTAGGPLNAQGEYSVSMYELNDGLPPGSYMVSVKSDQTVSDSAVRWLVPKRFSKPKTSGLTADIQDEVESLDYDLSWGDSDSGHDKPWVEKYR